MNLWRISFASSASMSVPTTNWFWQLRLTSASNVEARELQVVLGALSSGLGRNFGMLAFLM